MRGWIKRKMENKKVITQEIKEGYIEPVIKAEDYVFGSSPIPDVIVREDGQWDDCLPLGEEQAKNFETSGCTAFNSLSQIETFEKGAMGNDSNYCDRGLYIMAGITPPGADPSVVYETIRKLGVFDENLLPWTSNIDTLEKYASPKPLPSELLTKAKTWIKIC